MSAHYLDEGMERWIYATAHRNKWRVPAWYSVEDLIQDGFMCYAKCQETYGRLIRKRKPQKDDRRNFMALVRTTYLRHITDLANERTATPERAISQVHGVDDTAEAWLERNGPTEGSMGDLSLLLQQAPDDWYELLLTLANDGGEALRYQRQMLKKGKYFVRETTSQYLRRVAGITDKRVDIREQVGKYFQTQPA